MRPTRHLQLIVLPLTLLLLEMVLLMQPIQRLRLIVLPRTLLLHQALAGNALGSRPSTWSMP